MIIYILKRILMMIPVTLGVAFLIFTIMYFVPGDPARQILGPDATQAEIEAKRAEMGLNDPYIVRLGRYMYDTFIKLDFGVSYIFKKPIIEEIRTRFPRTMMFAIVCMFFRALIGIPIGIIAAVNRNRVGDKLSMFLALIGISLPEFWVAIMLSLLFALKLGWLPAYGIGGIKYYVLPVIAGSLQGIAVEARQMRSSMLEVIRSDFITTARAKGLPESKILYKHALPNALIPVLTVMGNGLGMSMAGALIIENVFSIPGMGVYLAKSIVARDYPAVQGTVVLLAVVFSFIMLLVDLAYAFFDPRIKAQYENQSKKFFRRKKYA